MPPPSKKRVFFAYFKPLTYSGQSAASELILEELGKRGWDCHVIPVYPLERGVDNHVKSYANFFAKQILTSLNFLRLLAEKKPILYLNLGQSLSSFVRFGLPYFPVRMLKPGMRVVVSLHGSVFMGWKKSQPLTRIFLFFLHGAEFVTVLGDRQKSFLTQLGVPHEKITVLPNTCEIDVCSSTQIVDKHKMPEIINILHLSLLIESKGFPSFLEAIEKFTTVSLEKPINVILCGPMAFTNYCSELDTAIKKELWITEKIESINANGGGKVNVKWIRGAEGEKKEALFKNAHLFVFPSRYPVEAQPLVLLEAMASGVALITSDVGEITSTLHDVDAAVLTDISSTVLATEMQKLVHDDERRVKMALSGRRAMLTKFSVQNYADRWEVIFSQLSGLEK